MVISLAVKAQPASWGWHQVNTKEEGYCEGSEKNRDGANAVMEKYPRLFSGANG
jgi:hypothetical protein